MIACVGLFICWYLLDSCDQINLLLSFMRIFYWSVAVDQLLLFFISIKNNNKVLLLQKKKKCTVSVFISNSKFWKQHFCGDLDQSSNLFHKIHFQSWVWVNFKMKNSQLRTQKCGKNFENVIISIGLIEESISATSPVPPSEWFK